MRERFAAAAFLAFLAADAQAQVPNFELVNRSGHSIVRLSIRPVNAESWRPAAFGSAIGHGGSARVGIPEQGAACSFDVRIGYDNGETLHLRDVNLCETQSLTVTNDEEDAADDDVLTG